MNKIWHYSTLIKTCPELVRTFQSERLCQNETFWSNRTCTKGRCKGNYPGQCATNEIFSGRSKRAVSQSNPCVDLKGICRDRSQVICDINKLFGRIVCNSNSTLLCANNETCIHRSLVCDGYVHCPGDNFIIIFGAAFWYKCLLSSFFVLTTKVCIFLAQGNWHKSCL